MARTMQRYVDDFESVPVLVLACYVRYRDTTAFADGASVYPACQNLLLAARALGYGGVMTGWHFLRRPSCGGCSGSPTTSSWQPPSPWAAPPGGTERSGAAHWPSWLRRAMGRGPGVGRRPRGHDPHVRRPAPTDRDEARCRIESRCCSRCSWKVDHARSRPAFE